MFNFINNLIINHYKRKYKAQCSFWFQYINIDYVFATNKELERRRRLLEKYSVLLIEKGFGVYGVNAIKTAMFYGNLKLIKNNEDRERYLKNVREVSSYLEDFYVWITFYDSR